MVLAVGCGADQRNSQPAPESTSEETTASEDTTVLRETTEETTAMEFSVGRSPMEEVAEEEDEGDVDTRRPPKASPEPDPRQISPEAERAQSQSEPEPEPQIQPAEEEPAPPEAVQPETECRFFNQSEFAQASPERKAFIQECDRAAGRVGKPPSPSPSPPASIEPQPKAASPLPGGCPSDAPIKGNASSNIYHVPGGQFYDRTNAEQCFATESDAQIAGYRRSQR